METIQNSSIQSSDYRDLPVAQLVESATNPRKRYDEAGLQELAESIRSQGVLAPLLVRELAKECFEIVAGSRRFRAAQLAGASRVPVRVVQLTDAEAIIAQVVENLQRENVHPLEEANGYRTLLSQRHSPALRKGQPTKGEADSSPALHNLDEKGYSRLLIEMSLLDAAHSIYARDGPERIEAVAKRYRINIQRIRHIVTSEFAAKRKKRLERAKAKSKRA